MIHNDDNHDHLDVDGNDLKEIKTVEDIPDLLHLHQGFHFKCPEG